MLLTETLDKIRLRYVSQRLWSINETPSVWCNLVWPDCNHCEQNCLCNVLKICGIHIKRLSFPQHVLGPLAFVKTVPEYNQTILKLVEMSEMLKILQYCNNVMHLNLPALDHSNSHDPDEESKGAVQKIKHLTSLSYCSFLPYLTLTVPLKELTIHAPIYSLFGSLTIKHREAMESIKSGWQMVSLHKI